MPISAALKRIYASAPTDQQFLETLSFSHSLFSKTFNLIADIKPWKFLNLAGVQVDYDVAPFKIQLPQTTSGSANQDLRVSLTNVGRLMMDELERANDNPQEPIVCIYRVYINQELTMPQSDELSLTIVDVQASMQQIDAVARRADILNRPFPFTTYRPDTFPGLDR